MSSFIVGLTGGIGSGKTVASDHFARLGVPVIDTDVIARMVVQAGQPALLKLVERFGDGVVRSDGELDRDALRILAFSSAENKAALDAITHPAIRLETIKQIEQVSYPYCVVVIPLLVPDSPFSAFLQRVLVVSADRETKIARVMQRSQLTREEVEQIMQSQLSDEERNDFADDIIDNNGTMQQAQQEVERLHELYLHLSAAA